MLDYRAFFTGKEQPPGSVYTRTDCWILTGLAAAWGVPAGLLLGYAVLRAAGWLLSWFATGQGV